MTIQLQLVVIIVIIIIEDLILLSRYRFFRNRIQNSSHCSVINWYSRRINRKEKTTVLHVAGQCVIDFINLQLAILHLNLCQTNVVERKLHELVETKILIQFSVHKTEPGRLPPSHVIFLV